MSDSFLTIEFPKDYFKINFNRSLGILSEVVLESYCGASISSYFTIEVIGEYVTKLVAIKFHRIEIVVECLCPCIHCVLPVDSFQIGLRF